MGAPPSEKGAARVASCCAFRYGRAGRSRRLERPARVDCQWPTPARDVVNADDTEGSPDVPRRAQEGVEVKGALRYLNPRRARGHHRLDTGARSEGTLGSAH